MSERTVLLPEPLIPTSAMLLPAFIRRSSPLNTATSDLEGYRNSTSRSWITPSTFLTSSPVSILTSVFLSSISNTEDAIWFPLMMSGAMASVSPIASAVTMSTMKDFITDLKLASSLLISSEPYLNFATLVNKLLLEYYNFGPSSPCSTQ